MNSKPMEPMKLSIIWRPTLTTLTPNGMSKLAHFGRSKFRHDWICLPFPMGNRTANKTWNDSRFPGKQNGT